MQTVHRQLTRTRTQYSMSHIQRNCVIGEQKPCALLLILQVKYAQFYSTYTVKPSYLIT